MIFFHKKMIKPTKFVKIAFNNVSIRPSLSSDDDFFVTNQREIYHYNNDNFKKIEDTYQYWDCFDVSRRFVASGSANISILNLEDKSATKCDRYQYKIYKMRISPDETVIATLSDDKFCRIWNILTGQRLFCYKGHTQRVSSLAFSVTGTEIFSGDYQGFVHKWTVKTGNTLVKSVSFNDHINGLSVTENFIATRLGFRHDEKILIIDTVTLICLRTISTNLESNGCVKLSPDETLLVSAYKSKVTLWDPRSGEKVTDFEHHTDWINCVCFFADGKSLISSSQDNSILIYKNIHLQIFLDRIKVEQDYVKTIQSFFHALMESFNELFPFNSSDYDNYFLMRILIHFNQ